MKQLRDYQNKAIEAVRNEMKKGHKRILLALATGAGKSLIARAIAEMAGKKGNAILYTAHRTILISQMMETFKGLENVTCGTLQSLSKKTHNVSVIIEDEAHYGNASLLRSRMPKDVITIGLSATPLNRDGTKLEGWDVVLDEVQLCDLIDLEYASPVRVLAAVKPDKSKIKIVRNDYDVQQSFDLMAKSEMIGDIIGAYKKHADGMRTMVFCVNIEHAEIMALEFARNGYKSGSIHSKKKDNVKVLEQFKSGDIDILTSVESLTTGVDIPDVYCILLATPIKSIVKAVQIYGRATRLNPNDPNKTALILDCAGVISDTIHPMQRMRFDKVARKNKKDLCSRDGCGGSKIMVSKEVDPKNRDGFYLVTIKHKCSKCDAVFNTEKMEEIPVTECAECGEMIDNEMMIKTTDNEIVFNLVCKNCSSEFEYRTILLTDDELKECNPPVITVPEGWDAVKIKLREARGVSGAKYHYKWSDHVIIRLKELEVNPDDVLSEIDRYNVNGWKLGALAHAFERKINAQNR